MFAVRIGGARPAAFRRTAASILCWAVLAAPLVRGRAVDEPPTPALHEVQGIADLQAAFDRDDDKVRIVLLLSPT
jgi:hypothetical protein